MLTRAVVQRRSSCLLRLFHSSPATLGVNDKSRTKVKPKPIGFDLEKTRLKKEAWAASLTTQFDAIKDRPVIHWKPKALQAWVVNIQNEPVSIVPLNPIVWGTPIRRDIVHRVVRWQRAGWMSGTHQSKRRGEVRGGGRKPRPQKGTGQARLGSIRSPLMIGGGKAHGPVPHSHAFDLPLRVVNMGVRVALSAKFQEGNMVILDKTELDSHKTKHLNDLLTTHWGHIREGHVAIVHGVDELDPNFALAARNIYNLDFYDRDTINTYDLVKRHHLIITQAGLKEVEKRLAGIATMSRVKFVVKRPLIPLADAPRLSVSKAKRKQTIAFQRRIQKEHLSQYRTLVLGKA